MRRILAVKTENKLKEERKYEVEWILGIGEWIERVGEVWELFWRDFKAKIGNFLKKKI